MKTPDERLRAILERAAEAYKLLAPPTTPERIQEARAVLAHILGEM